MSGLGMPGLGWLSALRWIKRLDIPGFSLSSSDCPKLDYDYTWSKSGCVSFSESTTSWLTWRQTKNVQSSLEGHSMPLFQQELMLSTEK
ncbi:unnamed protein product [Linum trigynum]|uniref:Uncharacterized protein n=1 Tax=Linum trigynum TaxID=586398 RepID=A0AAV2G6Y8_9ROSI